MARSTVIARSALAGIPVVAGLLILVAISALVASRDSRSDAKAARRAPPVRGADYPPPALRSAFVQATATERPADEPVYHSPTHICLSKDERRAFVVNQSANSFRNAERSLRLTFSLPERSAIGINRAI